MQLSKRLRSVASFVTEGNRLADIGTDHGYIPIFLVKEGIIPYAYAMDINRGPLLRADEHIQAEGLESKIETRLSNGMDKLNENEADTVLIAGMGGTLIIDILERGKKVLNTVNELVLSPHSEWEEVRTYLLENSYEIIREEMLIDAGKYYIIIKAKKGSPVEYNKVELKYGRLLLEEKNQIMKEYLLKEKDKYLLILDNLDKNISDKANERSVEILGELKCVEEALLKI